MSCSTAARMVAAHLPGFAAQPPSPAGQGPSATSDPVRLGASLFCALFIFAIASQTSAISAAPLGAGSAVDSPRTARAIDAPPGADEPGRRPFRLEEGLPLEIRPLIDEVLERHPGLARARHRAAAMAAKAPQVRSLPDPVAGLEAFILPPETRAGPQRLRLSLQQALPFFGKLKLAEQASLLDAAAAEIEIETKRLDLITETRLLAYELAFLEDQRAILEAERASLERFEGAAQARYATGSGLQQESVRIQTQITLIDTARLENRERHTKLLAAVNTLRDRPALTPVSVFHLTPALRELDLGRLESLADDRRPELAAARARIAAAQARLELAGLGSRPDFTVGFSFTAVERRGDRAASLDSPEDNGDDIFALQAKMNLPRKGRVEAAVAEAQAMLWELEEAKREQETTIQARIGDLAARIPLLHRHLDLLEKVLLKQAREALRSAETAYSTGKLNAVDLLDAEVVLFEVRIAAARTRTDLAVAWARLEREVASPLDRLASSASQDGEPGTDDGIRTEIGGFDP